MLSTIRGRPWRRAISAHREMSMISRVGLAGVSIYRNRVPLSIFPAISSLAAAHPEGDEPGMDIEPGQVGVEQGEGSAVKGAAGDEIIPGGGEGQGRTRHGRHARGGRDGRFSALQKGDFLLQQIDRGVADAGVDIAGAPARKKIGAMIRILEFKGGCHVDGGNEIERGHMGRMNAVNNFRFLGEFFHPKTPFAGSYGATIAGFH